MDTGTAPNLSALERHEAMVTLLRQHQILHSPPVEAALRAVHRHRFVPEATLEDAYGVYTSVTIKQDAAGTVLSSASAPQVVTAMLEQAQVQRGHRVLEVGAGTGYNAALLSHLVGPTGLVVTIEYDRDVTARAQAALRSGGYRRVVVRHGDGRAGAADLGPFDRILVTAGAFDIEEAWLDQLAPGGRLVVPLRLPWPLAAAFERPADHWVSVSTETCGFIPVTGPGARMPRAVDVAGGALVLRLEDDRPLDEAGLGDCLKGPRAVEWTGVRVDDGPGWEALHLWLMADPHTPGFTKISAGRDSVTSGLVQPLMPWGGPGFHRGATVAYLTNRRALGGEGERFELAVVAHGPDAPALATDVAGRLRHWNTAWRGRGAHHLEVHPARSGDTTSGTVIAARAHHTIRAVWTPTSSTV
ncbi:methyltransferase, FxLD system [Streptomyces sp. NPDC058470]|uniref:methyltransferase, FxLD system n=1 Tax=Streptomyces sp. NPDC058470 TaxID=3346515 RepID=UPI00365DC180